MFKTTIDSILKDFTVKINQLKAIADSKLAEADHHEQVKRSAEIARNDAKSEAARAAGIASRLETLIG